MSYLLKVAKKIVAEAHKVISAVFFAVVSSDRQIPREQHRAIVHGFYSSCRDQKQSQKKRMLPGGPESIRKAEAAESGEGNIRMFRLKIDSRAASLSWINRERDALAARSQGADPPVRPAAAEFPF